MLQTNECYSTMSSSRRKLIKLIFSISLHNFNYKLVRQKFDF